MGPDLTPYDNPIQNWMLGISVGGILLVVAVFAAWWIRDSIRYRKQDQAEAALLAGKADAK